MIRRRLIFFVLVTAALAVVQLGCQSSSAVPAVKPLPGRAGKLAHAHPVHFQKIEVHVVKGFGEFRDGPETFVPRGTNYVRLQRLDDFYGHSQVTHSTFILGLYDSTRAEDALTQMENLGYNVVRVFLNGCCGGSMYRSPNGPLQTAYLANVADFLSRAKNHGIRTIITTDFAYGQASHATVSPAFASPNGDFLTAEGVTSDQLFWTDVINGLQAAGAPLDDVFAFELRSQLAFFNTRPPFAASVPPAPPFTPGPVTTGDGMTYDTAQPNQWRPMMDSNVANWANKVTQTLKGLAPNTLVEISFFAPNDPTPWRDSERLAYPYPVLSSTDIDFVALQLYPGPLTLQQYATNFSLAGNQEKPAIMVEYGALVGASSVQQAATTLTNWQISSCDFHIKGWLLWTWDTDHAEQVDGPFWAAVDSGGVINNALAPGARPDPCAP